MLAALWLGEPRQKRDSGADRSRFTFAEILRPIVSGALSRLTSYLGLIAKRGKTSCAGMANGKDEENDLSDLLFKRAGICLMEVQLIEKSLALLLYPSRLIAEQTVDAALFVSLKDKLWSMTIGELERLYKVEFKSNRLLLFEIETIRRKRNTFVHSFYTQYAERWALSTATSSQLNEMIRELDKLHTLFAGFARRLESLGAKEKPKWDAIVKALVDFGKARGWELPDQFKS